MLIFANMSLSCRKHLRNISEGERKQHTNHNCCALHQCNVLLWAVHWISWSYWVGVRTLCSQTAVQLMMDANSSFLDRYFQLSSQEHLYTYVSLGRSLMIFMIHCKVVSESGEPNRNGVCTCWPIYTLYCMSAFCADTCTTSMSGSHLEFFG